MQREVCGEPADRLQVCGEPADLGRVQPWGCPISLAGGLVDVFFIAHNMPLLLPLAIALGAGFAYRVVMPGRPVAMPTILAASPTRAFSTFTFAVCSTIPPLALAFASIDVFVCCSQAPCDGFTQICMVLPSDSFSLFMIELALPIPCPVSRLPPSALVFLEVRLIMILLLSPHGCVLKERTGQSVLGPKRTPRDNMCIVGMRLSKLDTSIDNMCIAGCMSGRHHEHKNMRCVARQGTSFQTKTNKQGMVTSPSNYYTKGMSTGRSAANR